MSSKLYGFRFVTAPYFRQAFFDMMREKHSHIIGRKGFFAHEEEITPALREDCEAHGVLIFPIEE